MSNPFVETCLEKLSILGNVTVRAMFGGYGFYFEGIMFALIAYDVLYLKVDAETIGMFQKAGQEPFTYHGKAGKPSVMSYWTIPENVWKSPKKLKEWCESALAAAKRGKSGIKPKVKASLPKVKVSSKTKPKTKKKLSKKL